VYLSDNYGNLPATAAAVTAGSDKTKQNSQWNKSQNYEKKSNQCSRSNKVIIFISLFKYSQQQKWSQLNAPDSLDKRAAMFTWAALEISFRGGIAGQGRGQGGGQAYRPCSAHQCHSGTDW